jgi:hypothetical protein
VPDRRLCHRHQGSRRGELDSRWVSRDTGWVLRPGASRQELAQTLNAAYADGLLSENTLAHRLDQLFGSWLVDPVRLVGDLNRRTARRFWQTTVVDAFAAIARRVRTTVLGEVQAPPVLLALDWTGRQDELLVGRHSNCDVVLSHPGVSRRHARLLFRDGSWVLQDLASTNGTRVNGERVGRCVLRPGDRLILGEEHLTID